MPAPARPQVLMAGQDHGVEHLHYTSSSGYRPNYDVLVSGGGSARCTYGFDTDNGKPSDEFPTSRWGESVPPRCGVVRCQQ